MFRMSVEIFMALHASLYQRIDLYQQCFIHWVMDDVLVDYQRTTIIFISWKSFHSVALDSSHEISWSVEVYVQVR
jgi:hypothetical protein